MASETEKSNELKPYWEKELKVGNDTFNIQLYHYSHIFFLD